MAEDTTITPITDPNYNPETDGIYDPETFGAKVENQLELDYGTFDQDFSDFESKARGELNPLYNSVYDELSSLESQQKADISETYDDLLDNLQETYNQRGAFFSGEAQTGEQKMLAEKGRAQTNITNAFGTQRSNIELEKMGNIQSRAETLQLNAYNDYIRTKDASIRTGVLSALEAFYPDYAETVQAQLDDENALWLDIPYSDVYGEETATADKATSGSTQYATPANRDMDLERKNIGKFGGITGHQPSSEADWNFVNVATYGYKGDRDLDKEKSALNIYREVFKKNPSTGEDWNLLHAIAYVEI